MRKKTLYYVFILGVHIGQKNLFIQQEQCGGAAKLNLSHGYTA